ncbi:hypothetical protein K466DRAFT_607600 [Polyporus arcularius HHB13444]|uniref:Uncharacterized protein n=1 Tax=Polyporus arcularius HHB13444 TaxID=1314778 RepID=A0A5C3NMF5_9APHY|nr:hypothetical protein K466DRAFT_607600 [Polyporus arcularius HHB13444]
MAQPPDSEDDDDDDDDDEFHFYSSAQAEPEQPARGKAKKNGKGKPKAKAAPRESTRSGAAVAFVPPPPGALSARHGRTSAHREPGPSSASATKRTPRGRRRASPDEPEPEEGVDDDLERAIKAKDAVIDALRRQLQDRASLAPPDTGRSEPAPPSVPTNPAVPAGASPRPASSAASTAPHGGNAEEPNATATASANPEHRAHDEEPEPTAIPANPPLGAPPPPPTVLPPPLPQGAPPQTQVGVQGTPSQAAEGASGLSIDPDVSMSLSLTTAAAGAAVGLSGDPDDPMLSSLTTAADEAERVIDHDLRPSSDLTPLATQATGMDSDDGVNLPEDVPAQQPPFEWQRGDSPLGTRRRHPRSSSPHGRQKRSKRGDDSDSFHGGPFSSEDNEETAETSRALRARQREGGKRTRVGGSGPRVEEAVAEPPRASGSAPRGGRPRNTRSGRR